MRAARSFALILGTVAACQGTVREQFPDDASGAADGGGGGRSSSGGAGGGPGLGGDDAGTKPAPGNPSEVDLDAIEPCDDGLDVAGSADDFVKALGLCQRATEGGLEWGVIEADFRHHVGSNAAAAADPQHGILPKFGSVLVPREGARLGVLSTGYAREFDDETKQEPFRYGQSFGVGVGEVPDEFGGLDADAFDLINARVRLRVPTNAHGFSFDFDFHTSEWPNYLGSEFNDRFIVYLTDGAHPNGANLSFDSQNRPVSVNLGFFDRCVAGAATGCAGDGNVGTAACPAGPAELAGTGFGLLDVGCGSPSKNITLGGATGWLTTKAVVQPGEVITLEFVIWDENDVNWDSLVLLDKFRWEADDPTPGTSRPPPS